ncbi:basic salivary proline-rich protein [Salix suchowensis]|nr:basic salivary proline-rich protein [Salix suchowensis]
MASTKPLHLEITIISAKHLKNVNWRNGDLKPYATFYLDNSDHHLATHADDSLSLARLERTIYYPHDSPRFSPHPRRLPLQAIRNPQTSCRHREISTDPGKMEVKERPLPPPVQDYHTAPNYSHYYNPAPAPPPARDYREYSPSPYGYTDQYGYYPAYYPPQPPLPSQPLYNRASHNSLPAGPSAPVDLSFQPSPSPYDHKPTPPVSLPKTSNYGVPSGPSAPVDYSYGKCSGPEISGAMGGLNLEEGSSYEKEKVAADKESHSSYRL